MANSPFNANTGLDALAPILYANLDYVLRNPQGALSAITMDNVAARGTVGQTTRYFTSTPQTTRQFSPGVTPPELGAQDYGNRELKLEQHEVCDILWNGEEMREMATNGVGMNPMINASIQESLKKLTNAQEQYVTRKLAEAAGSGQEAHSGLLFDTDIDDAHLAYEHFQEQGVSLDQLSLVVDPRMATRIKRLPALNKVNTAGTSDTLRRGVIGDIGGMDIRVSTELYEHAAGTATGATLQNNQSAGDKDVVIAAGGSGSIVAGDLVEINGVEYGVETGAADISAGATITLKNPGLKEDATATDAVTVINSASAAKRYTVLDRNSFILSTRALALDEDMANDVMTIVDANTGMPFQVREYLLYGQKKIEIHSVWGGAAIKDEGIRLLHDA